MKASYLSLSDEEFKNRVDNLWEILKNCNLCGWKCGINRFENKGLCNSGLRMEVSSAFPHYGEERPLVGTHGSGTIFLSNCTCKCVFCQNWSISQGGEGRTATEEEIAHTMINLQNIGCHNINWVTPTHYVPQLTKALYIARNDGLNIPIVYNTGGYDTKETIKLLDGIIDIYMPDIKYGSNERAEKYSKIKNYWDTVREAVKEMHSQVGILKINDYGIAERGLLIRHLVLPGELAESEKVLKFIAMEISVDSYVNIMNQYRPCYHASDFDELNRTLIPTEFTKVTEEAEKLGLHRGF